MAPAAGDGVDLGGMSSFGSGRRNSAAKIGAKVSVDGVRSLVSELNTLLRTLRDVRKEYEAINKLSGGVSAAGAPSSASTNFGDMVRGFQAGGGQGGVVSPTGSRYGGMAAAAASITLRGATGYMNSVLQESIPISASDSYLASVTGTPYASLEPDRRRQLGNFGGTRDQMARAQSIAYGMGQNQQQVATMMQGVAGVVQAYGGTISSDQAAQSFAAFQDPNAMRRANSMGLQVGRVQGQVQNPLEDAKKYIADFERRQNVKLNAIDYQNMSAPNSRLRVTFKNMYLLTDEAIDFIVTAGRQQVTAGVTINYNSEASINATGNTRAHLALKALDLVSEQAEKRANTRGTQEDNFVRRLDTEITIVETMGAVEEQFSGLLGVLHEFERAIGLASVALMGLSSFGGGGGFISKLMGGAAGAAGSSTARTVASRVAFSAGGLTAGLLAEPVYRLFQDRDERRQELRESPGYSGNRGNGWNASIAGAPRRTESDIGWGMGTMTRAIDLEGTGDGAFSSTMDSLTTGDPISDRVEGKGATWHRLDPRMKERLLRMFRDSGGRVWLGNGWRSEAQQRSMFLDRYRPDPNGEISWNGQKWRRVKGAPAAPPGRSMHEIGLAADLEGDLRWMNANAGRYGLKHFANVNNEPWHVQPAELPNSRAQYEKGGGGADTSGAPVSMPAVTPAGGGAAAGGGVGGSGAKSGVGYDLGAALGSPRTVGTGPQGLSALVQPADAGGAQASFGGGATGFTPQQAALMAYQMGWRGQDLLDAVAIMGRESNYNPMAHNPNRATGDDSYGLFQINMLGNLGPARRQSLGIANNEALFDPTTNMRAAMLLYRQGGNSFHHWGGYKGRDNTYNTDRAEAMEIIRSAGLSLSGDGAFAKDEESLAAGFSMPSAPPAMRGSTGGVATIKVEVNLNANGAPRQMATEIASALRPAMESVMMEFATKRDG